MKNELFTGYNRLKNFLARKIENKVEQVERTKPALYKDVFDGKAMGIPVEWMPVLKDGYRRLDELEFKEYADQVAIELSIWKAKVQRRQRYGFHSAVARLRDEAEISPMWKQQRAMFLEALRA